MLDLIIYNFIYYHGYFFSNCFIAGVEKTCFYKLALVYLIVSLLVSLEQHKQLEKPAPRFQWYTMVNFSHSYNSVLTPISECILYLCCVYALFLFLHFVTFLIQCCQRFSYFMFVFREPDLDFVDSLCLISFVSIRLLPPYFLQTDHDYFFPNYLSEIFSISIDSYKFFFKNSISYIQSLRFSCVL